jgi:hypothetical protein
MTLSSYIDVLDEEITSVQHLLRSVPFTSDGATANFLDVYKLQHESVAELRKQPQKFPIEGSKLLKLGISLGSLIKTLELEEEIHLQQQQQQRMFLSNLQQYKQKQQTSTSRTPMADDPFHSPKPRQTFQQQTHVANSAPNLLDQGNSMASEHHHKSPVSSAPNTPQTSSSNFGVSTESLVVPKRSTPVSPVRQRVPPSSPMNRSPSMYVTGSPRMTPPVTPKRRPSSRIFSGSPKITISSSPKEPQQESPVIIPPSASPIVNPARASVPLFARPGMSRHVITSNSANQPAHHVKFVKNLLTILKNFDIGTSHRVLSGKQDLRFSKSSDLFSNSVNSVNSLNLSPIKLSSKQLLIEKLEININLDVLFTYQILLQLVLKILTLLRSNLIIENLSEVLASKSSDGDETSSIFSSSSNTSADSTLTIPVDDYLKLLRQIINRIVCGIVEPFIKFIYNELLQTNVHSDFNSFMKEL